MTLSDGVFPCVALSGGYGTLAVRQGDPRVAGWLVVYRFPVADPTALTEIARFPLPAGSPCFPNLYVFDDLLWLAYHDGIGQRLHNLTTGRDVLVVPGLSNPSAFGAGYFAYTEPNQPYRVHRLNLRTGEADQPRLGAPTGLSRILDDGRVVTIDEDRYALPGATIPAFAGPLAVGEGREGGVLWAHASGSFGTLYKPLDSFTPKCAADGDLLAITTAGSGSVRLFCGTLLALIAASRQAPDKVPGPINTEESPKEPLMPVAPNRLAELKAIAAAHPEINRLADGPFAPNRGGITQLAAQQFGAPFGRKSRDGSPANLSDDALCYKLADGRFEIYDILSGGNGDVQWNYVGTFADGENGFFVAPTGTPPVKNPPVDLPPSTPPPPSGLSEAQIRQIVQDELSKPRAPRRVAFKTHNGHYLCAEQGGGGEVNATRGSAGIWETFTEEVQ